jgi:hypothetical protein
VVVPAIGELLRRRIHPWILSVRHDVMRERGLDKVTRNITLVVSSERPVGISAERERRLHIAIGFLSCQDLRDPVLKRGPQLCLSRNHFRIALRIDHQGEAD